MDHSLYTFIPITYFYQLADPHLVGGGFVRNLLIWKILYGILWYPLLTAFAGWLVVAFAMPLLER